jgi:hypothetical protein
MPRKFNTPLLPFPDFCMRLLHQVLSFLYRAAQKSFFGHFRHTQGQAHI